MANVFSALWAVFIVIFLMVAAIVLMLADAAKKLFKKIMGG